MTLRIFHLSYASVEKSSFSQRLRHYHINLPIYTSKYKKRCEHTHTKKEKSGKILRILTSNRTPPHTPKLRDRSERISKLNLVYFLLKLALARKEDSAKMEEFRKGARLFFARKSFDLVRGIWDGRIRAVHTLRSYFNNITAKIWLSRQGPDKEENSRVQTYVK